MSESGDVVPGQMTVPEELLPHPAFNAGGWLPPSRWHEMNAAVEPISVIAGTAPERAVGETGQEGVGDV